MRPLRAFRRARFGGKAQGTPKDSVTGVGGPGGGQ